MGPAKFHQGVRVKGHAGLRSFECAIVLCGHAGDCAQAGGGYGNTPPGSRDFAHGARAEARQGLHRLVAKCRAQDDGERVLGSRQIRAALHLHAALVGGSGEVWDLGTYEVVEGNLDKGWARIHLTGRRMQGGWIFERADATWRLKNEGGRLLRALRSGESALADIPGAQRSVLKYAS